MKEYIFAHVRRRCSIHQPIFMFLDVNVCSQLGFPMLNDNAQVTPTCEKPSPATAQRDQRMEMR